MLQSKASHPEVSIIMPLFNSALYVGAAVESLMAQTFTDFELLVIDDGSTDGAPGVVSRFTDSRIRLFDQGRLGGPAAARNVGLANARGKYLVFFDSDDLAVPTMLADLVGFLSDHPDFKIAAGWLETVDSQGQCIIAASGYQDSPEKLASTMLFRNCLPTTALCIERCCLAGQEFDASFTLASDYEMWTRLVIHHQATVLPRELGRYRWHPQNITHQKKSFGTECLERIFRRQLARLGVEPTAEELVLHAGLNKLTFGTSRSTVNAAEHWLLKLNQANGEKQVYPQKPFRETLADQWYQACHSAAGHGAWTWWRFIDSPLAKWASFTPQQYYSLLRLCVRGALKNLLTRSPKGA